MSVRIEIQIARLLAKGPTNMTDQELAASLSTSRSAVQRALRRLRVARSLESSTQRCKIGSNWINQRVLKLKE